MTLTALQLPDLSPEQAHLPGVAGTGPLRIGPASPEPPLADPALPVPGPGQLAFGASQDPLPVNLRPRQLALLPDPPVWVAPAPAPAAARRPRRKRSSRGPSTRLSPGQLPLF